MSEETRELTHREALAAIPDCEIAALKELSDTAGLVRLGLHLGLIALTGTLVMWTSSPLLLAPFLVAHGIALIFVFAPLHETIHGTAFRTPALNTVVAEAFGFLILLPPRYFRYFHLAHHAFTQDPAHDPELAWPKPQTWRDYLIALSGWGYWRGEAGVVIRYAVGRDIDAFVPQKGRAKTVAEARRFLAGYGAIAIAGLAFGWTWLLWLWIVPAILGQPFLRAYLMAEHAGLPLVPDMLVNSRTTFTNALVRFLAWNMPYHATHHALPTVPFHRLPALTGHLRRSLRSTAAGYVDAHRQIVRSWPGTRDAA
jgi:fatty acid desaturase